MEDEALDEFSHIDQTNPNAVVVGLAPSKFNYEKVKSHGRKEWPISNSEC